MSDRLDLHTATASIGRRVGTYALDIASAYLLIAVIAGIAGGALLASSGGDAKALTAAVLVVSAIVGVLSFAWLIVYTAMQGGRGSIGQRATGVSIRDAATGTPVGFWRALLRNVVWALAGSIVVGYFSPLFDASGRRQGWHDLASRSVVVTRHASPSPTTAPRAPSAVPPPPSAVAVASGVISQVPGSVVLAAPVVLTHEPTGHDEPGHDEPGHDEPGHDEPGHDEPVLDELDQTRAAASLPSSRIADPAAIIVLTWDNGTRMAVYGRTLYGRNPETEQGAARVAVRDETLSLSKTHFELGGDEAGPWIIDRHSTNGSVLVRNGSPQRLIAGVQTTLRSGDRLEFGDRSALVSAS